MVKTTEHGEWNDVKRRHPRQYNNKCAQQAKLMDERQTLQDLERVKEREKQFSKIIFYHLTSNY